MISISATHLIRIFDIPTPRATIWQPHLEAVMARFDINTPLRAAHFIAQAGHESDRLVAVKEYWNPARLAYQQRYEGRADLGNTEPGDGERYMGRGLTQITGRKNYALLSQALGVDFVAQPQLLERLDYAALSAGWFWQSGAGLNLSHAALNALQQYSLGAGVDLNVIADKDDIQTITYCINGGLNGLDDRAEIFEHAWEVFKDMQPADGLTWERE